MLCYGDVDGSYIPGTSVKALFTYEVNPDTHIISFINKSKNAKNYKWEFGDGEMSNEISPFKKFNIPGTYSVKLSVIGVANDYDYTNINITIK